MQDNNRLLSNSIVNFVLPSGNKIDVDMVMAALEDGGMEHDHFLNTNTGQVTTLSENFMEADEYAEEMAIVEESKVHVRIEPLGSRVAYQWMADFSETLIKQEDPILYGKLQVALNGIGAIFYV